MPWNRLLVLTLTSALMVCASSQQTPRSGEVGEVGEKALPETAGIELDNSTTATWSEVVTEGAATEGWLKTFNDPELEQIVDEALRNNRQLAAAGKNLDTAAVLAQQAGAALAPAVAVATVRRADGRSDADTLGAGVALDLQWEVEIWAGFAAAEDGHRASRTELEAARQSLVAQIARAWYLATEANLQLALSQEAIEIYERIFEIVETRAGAGAAAAQDITHARTELRAAKDRQRLAIAALIPAVRSITALLGRYPTAELELPREFVPEPPPIPDGLPAALLERRTDLIAAGRRVAKAFQLTEAARVAKLPALPLTTSGGSPSSELIDLVGAGHNFFSIGANFVATPATDGEPQARQETALANYGAIALRAFSEVENGLTKEAGLRAREVSLAATAEDNAQAVSAARSRYDLGAADFLHVLQLQARALRSRILLLRTRNARLAARVDLHLALGGDFEDATIGAAQ